MRRQYFVKFVKYNNNTLSNLINKTVKFSTVYEFNDFNELHYISPPPDCITDNLQKIIKERISDRRHQCQFIENIKKGNYNKDFVNELCEYIKNYFPQSEPPQKYFQCILETIAYSSVGIFCLSNIDVFKDDSAQLMFAHYAENLNGLALIYELNEPSILTSVEYALSDKHLKKVPSCGEGRRLLDWINGNYNDMDDFRNKSNKWEYEKEYRVFNTPNPSIKLANDNGIVLKAILHTTRFNDENKKTLLTLNEKIYGNKIIIKEIAPSPSYYYFIISENNDSVHDWLSDLT